MNALRRLLAATTLLALSGCMASSTNDEDEGWRPFRADSPIFSFGGTLDRQLPPSGYGSSVTVPRLIGGGPPPPRLREEDGNVWPAPEKPRTTLTDPESVAKGIPNFRPQGRPPEPGPLDDHVWDDPSRNAARAPRLPGREPSPAGSRPGDIIRRPDGSPAVTGAGTDGVGTTVTPGRPGVGTSFPDGRGGRVLVEPGGGTVIAPR